jgi:hypothetical protein
MVIGELVHQPVDQLRQQCALDRPPGFAAGRQPRPSPRLRPALVARTPQPTGCSADELHLAGLPRAVAPRALRRAPTPACRPAATAQCLASGAATPPHAPHLPGQPMTPQGFARLCLVALLPTPAHPSGLGALGNPPRLPEVPVSSVAHAYRVLGLPRPLARHCLQGWFPAVIHPWPVALQLPPMRPCGALHVVEHLGPGARAGTGAVARAMARDGIVAQLQTPRGVVRALPLLARGFFLAPSPGHRIVCSRGADIVGDQGLRGDDRGRVGLVPEPADVCAQLAPRGHQRLRAGHPPARAGARLGSPLPPRPAAVVEGLDVPWHLVPPAGPTCWIGGDPKGAMDTADGLLFGSPQAAQVCGTMTSCRFVGHEVAQDVHRVLHEGRKIHHGRHQGGLPSQSSGFLGPEVCYPLYAMQPSVQKFSR